MATLAVARLVAGPSPGILAAAIIVPVVVVAASVAAAACWLARRRRKRRQQQRGGSSSSKTDLELGLVDSAPGAGVKPQDLGGDPSQGSSAKLVRFKVILGMGKEAQVGRIRDVTEEQISVCCEFGYAEPLCTAVTSVLPVRLLPTVSEDLADFS
jgi:hypothetical protein